jgi:hypothetical protein
MRVVVRQLLIVAAIFLTALMILAPVAVGFMGLSIFGGPGPGKSHWVTIFFVGIFVLPVLVFLIANDDKSRKR